MCLHLRQLQHITGHDDVWFCKASGRNFIKVRTFRYLICTFDEEEHTFVCPQDIAIFRM